MAGAAGGASAARPNILWYCSDQQRHDTIRALGQPHIATPRLDVPGPEGARHLIVMRVRVMGSEP